MKNNKKAFTIVELVIVIAIIAILAAVLIPTFAAIIKKANISKDTQLIRNLNTALAADSATNGKHLTMQSALDAAYGFGYDVGRINVSATDNEILWDQKNDVFCYFDADAASGSQVRYIPESNIAPGDKPDDSSYLYWRIISVDEADSNGAANVTCGKSGMNWSVYLKSSVAVVINVADIGVDVGTLTSVEAISYTSSSSNAVVIRSNGGTVSVDNANATVNHHGFATEVTVTDVSTTSYHEFGRVGRLYYYDNDGKIVFESTAVVYCYMNASSDPAQDLSDVNKMPGAIVYTNVTSTAVATVYADKTVTLTGNLVDIASCHNHLEDFDVIEIGEYTYVVCKCCGAFSMYGGGNAEPIKSSVGITNSNAFGFVLPLPMSISIFTDNTETSYSETTYDNFAAATAAVEARRPWIMENGLCPIAIFYSFDQTNWKELKVSVTGSGTIKNRHFDLTSLMEEKGANESISFYLGKYSTDSYTEFSWYGDVQFGIGEQFGYTYYVYLNKDFDTAITVPLKYLSGHQLNFGFSINLTGRQYLSEEEVDTGVQFEYNQDLELMEGYWTSTSAPSIYIYKVDNTYYTRMFEAWDCSGYPDYTYSKYERQTSVSVKPITLNNDGTVSSKYITAGYGAGVKVELQGENLVVVANAKYRNAEGQQYSSSFGGTITAGTVYNRTSVYATYDDGKGLLAFKDQAALDAYIADVGESYDSSKLTLQD